MRRLLTALFTLFLASTMFAQLGLNILPKKEDLKDFTGKTTKIVLSEDNSLLSSLLRDAVEKNWYLSPFEYCSMEEFEKIKTDTTYYFLIVVNGQHSKENEPAMEFLTLVKGNPAASKSVDEMGDIITLPLQSINSEDDRVFSYLPAYIKIVQAHVLKCIKDNLSAYIGMSSYSSNINDVEGTNLLMAKEDLSSKVSDSFFKESFGKHAQLVDREYIETALQNHSKGVLVSDRKASCRERV